MNKNIVEIIERSTELTAEELMEMKERIGIDEAKDKGMIDEILMSVSSLSSETE